MRDTIKVTGRGDRSQSHQVGRSEFVLGPVKSNDTVNVALLSATANTVGLAQTRLGQLQRRPSHRRPRPCCSDRLMHYRQQFHTVTSIAFSSTWEVWLMANFLTNIISPPKRKVVYGTYSAVGLAIGATQAGFSAVESRPLTG